jgi:hypothetical protein
VLLAAIWLGVAYTVRLTWRRLVIFAASVTVFETAIAEAYDHHGLPATGWWSWIVLGLVAAPAVAGCAMAGALLGNALAWRHVHSAYQADCLAALLDTALRVLDGLDTPARQRDHSLRLRWAAELEDAARCSPKALCHQRT